MTAYEKAKADNRRKLVLDDLMWGAACYVGGLATYFFFAKVVVL